jgi:hypothetical protein
MRRRIFRLGAAVAAFAVAGFAHAALASAGNGIRLGGTDGRLHPFLDFETRYDSNISYGSSGNALGDAIFHFRPGLELKIQGDLAVVEFSGAIDWAQYAGLNDPGDGTSTREMSKLYAEAGFGALFNPRGVASVRLDDDFRRRISTSSLTFGSAVISNSNTLALSVPWKPGGGALVLLFRGQWMLESFQPYMSTQGCVTGDATCSTQTLGDLGYNDYRSGVEAQWRFLPRTSAVFQTGFFSHVPNAPEIQVWDEVTGTTVAMKLPNVSGIDVLTGVTGLVTPHIGASLKAGYGQTFESGGGGGTFLTDVGGEWIPMQSASVRAGYSRAFGVDPMASTYTTNSVYLTGRIRMMQRYTFKGSLRYDNLAFEKLDGTTDFFRLEPGVEATVSRWMTASLGYAFSSRKSSLQESSDSGALQIPPALAFPYSKNEVWLKLGFTY